jgi:AcrR family transcriptional regulator
MRGGVGERRPRAEAGPMTGPLGEAGGRDRMLEAMLELVSNQGFEKTETDEVLQLAGTSRADFERSFSSKEDCALAVFDRFLADYVSTVRAAYSSEGDWPDSLRAAAYAAADWIAGHPREVRFGTVEMLWASEIAQARREEGFQTFVEMVDAGRQRAADPNTVPEFTAEGVIGSIAEIMTKELQGGGELEPHKLAPELMYLAVRPYLGEEAAARELTMPPPQKGRPG